MDIVFLGAGRLATQLAQAFHGKGHRIRAVYSRTLLSASPLAAAVGALATDNIDSLPIDADVYIVAVKDAAIENVLQQASKGREKRTFFHTAGSVPLSVFQGVGLQHYGVLYPIQTFSKERNVDFSSVPFFIEAVDVKTMSLARELSASLSQYVYNLDSDKRRHLHLAAVFACNFANHCYALSAEVLESCGIPFQVLLPLIMETASKVADLSPRDAQTGPAVRFDRKVIQAQQQLLADRPGLLAVYDVLTRSIHELASTSDKINPNLSNDLLKQS